MAQLPHVSRPALPCAGAPRRRRMVARLLRAVALAAVIVPASLTTAPWDATAAPEALPVPPAGGLTQGIAGTSDPAALVAGQSFAVETVSVLDPVSQQWLVFVPNAPEVVHTLTSETLTADAVVTLRRAGVLADAAPAPTAPEPPPPVAGEGTLLVEPPPGGLVQAVSGTNDPATLVARQRFVVESVSVLDVASQRWLVYVPSAPAFASTLKRGLLEETSIVTVRRLAATASPAPTPTPGAEPSDVNTTAEAVMLASVNEEREAAGLEPLVLDPAMVAVARAHSRDMIARDFFDHVNPDGDDPFDRMRAAGITFGYAAENIVPGQSGASAHAMLMASELHRVNIMGAQYRRIGIGAIVRPGGGVMVTELFAD